MNFITVKELYKNSESYLDKTIEAVGWVRSNRGSKAFGFLVISDGTYFNTLQVVYHDSMENFAEISKLNVGAAVIVKGTLVATPEAKQPFEIQADTVVVEGDSAPDYPCRRRDIRLSSCVRLRICGRGRIRFRLYFGYGLWLPMPSIGFSRSRALCMCIRR